MRESRLMALFSQIACKAPQMGPNRSEPSNINTQGFQYKSQLLGASIRLKSETFQTFPILPSFVHSKAQTADLLKCSQVTQSFRTNQDVSLPMANIYKLLQTADIDYGGRRRAIQQSPYSSACLSEEVCQQFDIHKSQERFWERRH